MQQANAANPDLTTPVYGKGMIQHGHLPDQAAAHAVAEAEQAMRLDLAEGDAVLGFTRPILLHLLANRDHALFSDEVIARVRGMVEHMARQMLMATATAAEEADPITWVAEREEGLAALLLQDSTILGHAHALTQEAQLAEQLQRRSGFDGVLSPLVQELAAASDPQVAAGAMRVIAAQARFLQTARRMELPLGELPGDLFRKVLLLLRTHLPDEPAVPAAEAALRSEYDEGLGRLGQLGQLVIGLGPHATRALSIDHAGLALFATALGMASAQDRNLALLSLGENQLARLALALRAAGLSQGQVEEQFLFLHPDALLPDNFATITPDRARALLAASAVTQDG